MKPSEYKAARERIGTQAMVAARLGLHRVTIAKREAGTIPVTTEAAIAIRAIPKQIAERKKVVGGGGRNATKRSGAGSQN